MNSSQRLKIKEILPLAVQDTLDRFPVRQLTEAPKAGDQPLLVSILGFKSPLMSGSLLLACQDSFLTETCPGLKPDEPNPKPFVFDWIGELINLVAGYFKNSLLSFDIDLALNPPSISEANLRILETYASRMPSETFWFQVEDKSFCLVFCAEMDASLDFDANSAELTVQVKPGDAVYQPLQAQADSENQEIEQTDEMDLIQDSEVDSSITEEEMDSSEEAPAILDEEIQNEEIAEDSEVHQEVLQAEEKTADILEFELKPFDPIDSANDEKEELMNPSQNLQMKPELVSSQATVETSEIDSIQTTRQHELVIHFTHGVSYTIPVEQWLLEGRHEVQIEGQTVKLSQTVSTHVVDIHGMRIDFRKKQAA